MNSGNSTKYFTDTGKAPTLVSTCGNSVGMHELHCTLADPSSCKTCETDVGVFLHVDDGFAAWPKSGKHGG